ncbi:hypothetical protein BGX31_003634 [Mortierella sp. GBA43]|nr:hypothetical protein BGX31_003634 [Mortierella sp. GBA43]
MAAGLGQVYDIDTDKWTDIFTNKAMERLWGRGAALDPATGLVYMPFAYPNADGSFSMLKVNLKDGSIASDNNSNMLPTVSEYAVAWSTPLKSLVYVIEGGTYTYNSIDGWKSFTAPPNGASPLGSCLVAANGGKQLVLFGGYSKATNVTQSSIYILDVATSTWTTGASAPISNGRHAAACAVSNDYFIAWGGDTAAGTDVVAPENLTIVYNLKTNIWTTEYIGPSGSPDSHTPVNKGVVISVVGLVLLIVVVGSVFIYRRRSRRSVANTLPSMLDPPTPTSPAPHSPTAPPMLPPKNRSRSVKHKPETSSQNTVVEQVLSGENKSEVRLGTVQVGSYGTRPVSQDPGCCNIELIVSQEVEYVTANNNVPKAPVLVLNPPLVQPPTPVQSSLTPPPPVKPPRLARSPSLVKLSPPVGQQLPTESTVTEVIELYYDPQVYQYNVPSQ